jgi:hypothetical protein
MGRALIKHKIRFTTKDAEPRFEIEGGRFTTQELMMLSLEKKITHPDLFRSAKDKAYDIGGFVIPTCFAKRPVGA